MALLLQNLAGQHFVEVDLLFLALLEHQEVLRHLTHDQTALVEEGDELVTLYQFVLEALVPALENEVAVGGVAEVVVHVAEDPAVLDEGLLLL